MKYPNPTFIKQASDVKHGRRTRIIVITAVIVLVVAACLFINKIANMQEKYRQDYPELVGIASNGTDSTSETVLEPFFEETVETGSLPSETEDTSSSESVDNNFYFRSSYPLQTITHELRDQYLDDLKQDIQDYIAENSGERICVRYVNLRSNEQLGLNDLEPIVPAGSISLPVSICIANHIGAGTLYTEKTFVYEGENSEGNSSLIAQTARIGDTFTIRDLIPLSVSQNDSIALSYLLNALGGMSAFSEEVSLISGYIRFDEDVLYRDYLGGAHRSAGHTSLYDMTSYAEYLYNGYINHPDIYQNVINAMSDCSIPNGASNIFSGTGSVLAVVGRNENLNAYTLTSIVDGDEPFILSVYCECSSFERAVEIQSNISLFVSNFISQCHN